MARVGRRLDRLARQGGPTTGQKRRAHAVARGEADLPLRDFEARLRRLPPPGREVAVLRPPARLEPHAGRLDARHRHPGAGEVATALVPLTVVVGEALDGRRHVPASLGDQGDVGVAALSHGHVPCHLGLRPGWREKGMPEAGARRVQPRQHEVAARHRLVQGVELLGAVAVGSLRAAPQVQRRELRALAIECGHDLLAAGDAQREIPHRLRDAEDVVQRGVGVEGGVDAAALGRLDPPSLADLVGRLFAPVGQQADDPVGNLVAADR